MDNAEYINAVIVMYNLMEYSNNYLKGSRSLADHGDGDMKQKIKNLKTSTVLHQCSTFYKTILCYCFKFK